MLSDFIAVDPEEFIAPDAETDEAEAPTSGAMPADAADTIDDLGDYEILDLNDYQPETVKQAIRDKNGLIWKVYGGTPLHTLLTMLRYASAWRRGTNNVKEVAYLVDTMWRSFKRANPGRTEEQFIDGIDGENLDLVANFLYKRFQAQQAAKAAAALEAENELTRATLEQGSPTARTRARASGARSRRAR